MTVSKLNNVEVLSKSLGANGPSFRWGVPLMLIGFATVLVGFGTLELLAILIGFLLLFLAALLILSIDCIAIDKDLNKLHLYKEYFITKKGEWISVDDYSSVCIYYEIDRPRNNRGSMNQTQFKTFEVFLISKKGEKLSVKQFGLIDDAKQLQYILASNTGLELMSKPIREIKTSKTPNNNP